MKVFYRNEQTVYASMGFSRSPRKPELVVQAWKRADPTLEVQSFEPVTRAQLYHVHRPAYVDGVLNGTVQNGFGNFSAELRQALPYVSGSMVAAALHAYRTGETALSPTSGAHHAKYDRASGYCTFNFLVLAALEAQRDGAKLVGIVDCDMHHGDGTDDIISTMKLRNIRRFSFGLTAGRALADPEAWLTHFKRRVGEISKHCDLIIYNAGVDSHTKDPLGGVLSTRELIRRDEILFSSAHQSRTPVALSLAGGYQLPLGRVVKLHTNTFLVAKQYEWV